MASSDYPPPLLRDQQGIAEPAPDAASGISERERLRAALRWTYSCHLYLYEPTERYSIRIRIGAESSDSAAEGAHLCFTVTNVADAPRQILRLERVEGALPLAAFELIPLDAEQRAVAYERSDETADLGRLSFVSEDPIRSFRLELRALDALRIGALRVCVIAGADASQNCFAHDFQIALDRDEVFSVGKLLDGGDDVPTIAAQLDALWDTLLGEVAEVVLGVHCLFRSAGVPAITSPVLMLPSSLYCAEQMDELSARLASAMQQWLETQSPPPGRFVLDLSLAPPSLAGLPPTLRLRQLELIAESVA